jgi:arsenate reductase (thioredoxin)
MSSKRRVLFLCTGNSCRSQMAEGWARHLKGDRIEPYSAGTHPSTLNMSAVKVMAEAGLDISSQWPKHVSELDGTNFDYVVTVCDQANESCPVLPGNAKRLHIGFEDPPRLAKSATSEVEALTHYRRVRDEIKAFVAGMPANLEQGK